MQFQGQWWNVSGEVNWRWDDYNNPMVISVGGANKTWSVDQSQFISHTTGTSKSYNIEIGGEAKFMGVASKARPPTASRRAAPKASVGRRAGIWRGSLQACRAVRRQDKSYKYFPYTYMQEARSAAGEKQAYMVLDYIVP